MPLYYFHLRDSDTLQDVDGTDLPDLPAAQQHATAVAHELMFRNHDFLDRNWSHWTLTIYDAEGAEVHALNFSDLEGDKPDD